MMKLFKVLVFLTGAVAAGALAAEFWAGPEKIQHSAAAPDLPDRKPLLSAGPQKRPVRKAIPSPEPATVAPPDMNFAARVDDESQAAPVIPPASSRSEPTYTPQDRQDIDGLVQENVLHAEENVAPAIPPAARLGTAPPSVAPVAPVEEAQISAPPVASAQQPAPGSNPAGLENVATAKDQLPGVPLSNPRRRISLENRIGQMLIFGFQGSSPDQKFPQAVARQLATGKLGGIIFLRYNLPDPKSARRLMEYFHKKTANVTPQPLFVLDQEGGRVQRLGKNVNVKRWPTPASIGKGSLSRAKAEYDDMAAIVRDWGFNVNLGPVVDVNVNPANPIIGKLGRSFSADPKKVADYSRAFIDAHRSRRILTALKHFPGHGSSRKDSHLGFTDISRTWQADKELAPYQNLIRSNHVDMVMMGHLYLDKFRNGDAKKNPATLSKTVIDTLLRKNPLMGNYDGVIISDDMEMGAIRKHYKTFEAAIKAIKAGVDLLIVSNSAQPRPNLPESYISAIARAARKDAGLMRRINQSYDRIIKLKASLTRGPLTSPNRSTQRGNIRLPVSPATAPKKARAASADFNRASLAGKLDAFFAAQPH